MGNKKLLKKIQLDHEAFNKGYQSALEDILKAHQKDGESGVIALVESKLPADFWLR